MVLQVVGDVEGAADDAEHVAAGPGHADEAEDAQGAASHAGHAAYRLGDVVAAFVLAQRHEVQHRVDDLFLQVAVLQEETQDADEEDEQGEE